MVATTYITTLIVLLGVEEGIMWRIFYAVSVYHGPIISLYLYGLVIGGWIEVCGTWYWWLILICVCPSPTGGRGLFLCGLVLVKTAI